MNTLKFITNDPRAPQNQMEVPQSQNQQTQQPIKLIFIEEMKKIQSNLLNFLDNVDNHEENYQNLVNFFDEIQIYEDFFRLKSFLNL